MKLQAYKTKIVGNKVAGLWCIIHYFNGGMYAHKNLIRREEMRHRFLVNKNIKLAVKWVIFQNKSKLIKHSYCNFCFSLSLRCYFGVNSALGGLFVYKCACTYMYVDTSRRVTGL